MQLCGSLYNGWYKFGIFFLLVRTKISSLREKEIPKSCWC